VDVRSRTLLGLTVAVALLAAAGCSREFSTNPAPFSTDAVVFGDNFGEAVTYQAFLDSKLDAVQIDASVAFEGAASLRVTVPGPDGDGWFAGGAFTTWYLRDLTEYNAVTFYARASREVTLNTVGAGNDNTGTSLYESSQTATPLSTDWTRVIVPIPNPSKLAEEGGLFFFAEGHENDMGYDFWMDEIKFEHVDGIRNPRPTMYTRTGSTIERGWLEIMGTSTTVDVEGEDVLIQHLPACFDYSSSDESVARVIDGRIWAVGIGTATITGKLGDVDVEGAVTVNVDGGPEVPAPEPTVPSADVISLFSDVYSDVHVDTWYADWSNPQGGEAAAYEIDGDNMKLYTDLVWAGIEFISQQIDATAAGMTHLHLDVWAPSGGLFRVKLVDFGPNGVYDEWGGDDSGRELTFNGGTEPPFWSGQWSALEIPLSDFSLNSYEHLAQLVISSSDVRTVVVDNVYFHR
jgi:hypothetical protein